MITQNLQKSWIKNKAKLEELWKFREETVKDQENIKKSSQVKAWKKEIYI